MKKHSHYHKDVSHLQTIDIYAVCELFGVNDPSGARQHAIKKLLCAGTRGAKSERQDLQEAADTINRRIQMLDGDLQLITTPPPMPSWGYKPGQPVGPDVSFDGDSDRQKAVEQNGNDGVIYAHGGPLPPGMTYLVGE